MGICLASSWNTDLVKQVGHAIGHEAKEYGVDLLLAPGMNLLRNPLCGRSFEYYSEDPFVTGSMATAMTLGIQSQGVGVCAKHFAVNSQESDRDRVDERVSQRALRELYLKGFEMLVKKGKPWALMSSYNKINGVYAQNNKELLTTILRDEWGFNGMVVTDWIGVRSDLPVWTEPDAGNELLMPGYSRQVREIIAAVKDGRLSEKILDREVRRILQYIVKTPRFHNYQYSNQPDLKADANISRQASTEGMVLLKNEAVNGNPALPLSGVKTVALLGVNSYDFLSGGLGSGSLHVPYVVDLKEGLNKEGVSTTEQLTKIYESYIPYALQKLHADMNPEMWFLYTGKPKLPEVELSSRCIEQACDKADAAIITIGRQAGEGMDRDIATDFQLSPAELSMIDRASSVFHQHNKPVIVILNSGAALETASWRDKADAILVAWQPGEEGGAAIADILLGKVNPSGHLTQSWPLSIYDDPSTKNYPQKPDYYNMIYKFSKGQLQGVNYSNHEEDIYVGYRYYDTFKKKTAYPFGYGLSYSSFSFSNVQAGVRDDGLDVTVTVKNIGSKAGKQVAQVYVSAPGAILQKPAKELKAFAKTKELKPGESQTLSMHIDRRELASFDEAHSQWVGEAGVYRILVGDNVENILGEAKVKLNQYTEKVHNVMRPTEEQQLLH